MEIYGVCDRDCLTGMLPYFCAKDWPGLVQILLHNLSFPHFCEG
jgi:hypothetical protein